MQRRRAYTAIMNCKMLTLARHSSFLHYGHDQSAFRTAFYFFDVLTNSNSNDIEHEQALMLLSRETEI